jgi:hypothetical protein
MLHGFLRNGLLIVAALAATSTVGAETARADDAQVTVIAPGGAQQTLSLAALGGGDVSERPYTLRSAEGESTVTVSGFSTAAILDAAGVDPYGFSYLEAQRPAGGSVLLSRDQALDPSAFPDGPPVVHPTATGTAFLRPGAGAGDLNATDSFEAPQGITLVLRKGSPLRVRAQASTLRTRPGRPVTFTAIVERAGAGERLTWSWYFDDGHSAEGAGVRHRFAKRGSYDVVVGVTTAGDETGASAVVTVQVGPPLAGPDRKGGGTNDDVGAPDHGAATGGSAPGTSGLSGASPNPGATGESSRPCPQNTEKCERSQVEKRGGPESAGAAGKRVSGLLLSSATTSPEPTAIPAARTGKLSETGSGPGLPAAALGLLATIGLLGLGALAEMRSHFVGLFPTNSERTLLR